jgi:hypothetical protein
MYRGRNTFTREEYVKYQLPPGALKVSDKLSDAVAYLYERSTPKGPRPCGCVFFGKQAKPAARYAYRDEAERERSITQLFASRRDHDKRKVDDLSERKTATATKLFEVGKTYHDRAASDYDTIYSFKIVSRTAKQLTIEEHGKVYKRGIYVYNGVECCKPHGTYSMCSVIRADKDGAA